MCGIFVSARVSTAHGEEDAFKKRLEEVNSARGMCRILARHWHSRLYYLSQDLMHKIATLSLSPSIR